MSEKKRRENKNRKREKENRGWRKDKKKKSKRAVGRLFQHTPSERGGWWSLTFEGDGKESLG